MTELIIDGVQAVLPKDLNVQVKRENPFITKNGEYTYEITLPLTNPTNASLYAHLNRLNSVQDVKSKRTAVLIANNRVYCNGTEIITGWTENTVTLQITSGNSELNYFIGGNLMISSLEMKSTIPGFDGPYIIGEPDYLKYVQKTYPEVDYCLTPIQNGDSGETYNQWRIKINEVTGIQTIGTEDFLTLVPQPYLCAYIADIIRALGYTLTNNQLEDTVFKDLYICHTGLSDKWSDMLPGWSVNDFFTQIENMFNVVCLVDNSRRTVRIVAKVSFYAGAKSMHVRNVADVYEAEVEEPDTNESASSNIIYKAADTEWWRWRSLPEAVVNASKKKNIPLDYEPGQSDRLAKWFKNSANKRKDTIYTDMTDGREYLYRGEGDESVIIAVYNMVNEFAQLTRDNPTSTIELEIVPVEMAVKKLPEYTMRSSDIDYQRRGTHATFLPIVNIGNENQSDNELTLEDMIVNNTGGETNGKNNIRLAFYSGLSERVCYNHVGKSTALYPFPYIDEYILNGYTTRSIYHRTNNVGASLRLTTLDKLLYEGEYNIDYLHGIKIESYDSNLFDPRSVFEIRNKRYVCKEMEYTLDTDGRKGAWSGTFYPIEISDTEADARWILTDGKWRDGGVWLDNGRWLDG